MSQTTELNRSNPEKLALTARKPVFALLAFAFLLIAGCGTVPKTSQPVALEQAEKAEVPDPLPLGAKVALSTAPFVPMTKFDEEPHNDVSRSRGLGHDPVTGAAGGALVGAAACLQGAAVFPLLAIACLPVGAAVGAVGGGVVGAVRMSERLSAERARGEAERARGEIDKIAKDLIAPQRPLLGRVQSYLRASGMGDGAELPNAEPQSVGDAAGNHQQPDYVFEVSLTGARLASVNTYWIYVYAKGRLVRTRDNTVVDTFSAVAATNSYTSEVWTADNGNLVYPEVDSAVDDLAKQFVDKWIKPSVEGRRILWTRASETTAGGNNRADEAP